MLMTNLLLRSLNILLMAVLTVYPTLSLQFYNSHDPVTWILQWISITPVSKSAYFFQSTITRSGEILVNLTPPPVYTCPLSLIHGLIFKKVAPFSRHWLPKGNFRGIMLTHKWQTPKIRRTLFIKFCPVISTQVLNVHDFCIDINGDFHVIYRILMRFIVVGTLVLLLWHVVV